MVNNDNLITSADEVLLTHLAEGNEKAFEVIYNRYWHRLYNAAHKRTKDPDICRDVVQEVFCDLWRRRSQVEVANLGAYLQTATRYQVLKKLSRQEQTSFFFDKIEALSFSLADHSVNYKDLEALVRSWADMLPRKKRAIFLLHYHQGLSTMEIAGNLNISVKTVQNQLRTALNELRDYLISHRIPLCICIILCDYLHT
ncbi:MAG TPA: sigma-70 family RNA polymerase sigma factor [Chitinophaga sp.]|uniref:RNA polymerase sigma factor n=1 Tax=Chitinophaga sp. TaxID=1869181 RepID=UPI002C3B8FB5|nr:sigma-70 family RNA polymerase sigma factor [Chitinophaga sp.]HVI47269.1 sigma-70 family RNA polymerase sigma factor [Chitinophaga sp.]